MIERDLIDRRRFLKTVGGAVAVAGLGCAPRKGMNGKPMAEETRPFECKLSKAVNLGMVKGPNSILDKFKLLAELGFDGVELNSPNKLDPDELLKARDDAGLPIHGVVNGDHWRSPLSHADPAVRAKCVQSMRTSLSDAKSYGATGVLLVPAKVDATMPYDQAYTRSQAEIRKLIPLAEELGVKILIENVWNNFLLSPLEMARYIDELDSPMVRSYFDVGNIVRMGWPEQWIRVLGQRIGKLHIKEYSRKKQKEEGLWKGFSVKIGDGDCNWPAVMKALREIRFSGWATAEVGGGDRNRLKDIADRMDRAFAS